MVKAQALLMPVLLFAVVLVAYLNSHNTTPLTDTKYVVPTALSVVRAGNFDVDEYPYSEGDVDVGPHRISLFPLGTSLLIAPAVAVLDRAYNLIHGVGLYEHLQKAADWPLIGRIHLWTAACATALAALVIYLIGRRRLNRPRAALLALIFAFGTSAWSTASGELWQHTLSELLLAITLYLLLLAEERPAIAAFASIPLALSYIVRPTNSASVLFLTVFVLLRYRQQFLAYVLLAAPLAAAFFLVNYTVYGSLLQFYYLPQRLGDQSHLLEALAGNLISPARGLLVYSPVLVFMVYGIMLRVRQRRFSLLDGALLAVFLLHWFAISSFAHWWGGAAYGPRFFTDMLPYCMYFLMPVVEDLRLPKTLGQAAAAALFGVAVAASVFMHYRGATQPATWQWNGAYANVVAAVDDAPARLWDWSDPQFWRGLRPARLAVQPLTACVAQQGPDDHPRTKLLIQNLGDQALRWDAALPGRVFAEPAMKQVPALGYSELTLDVDGRGLPPGPRALGGAYITATTTGGQLLRAGTVMIPLDLQVRAGDETGKAGSAGCEQAPDDLTIHREGQGATANRLLAAYGPGWYDRESADGASWRWAASPAQIYVYSTAQSKARISGTLSALYGPGGPEAEGQPATMYLTIGGLARQEFNAQVGRPFAVDTTLQAGWNLISFTSQAGNRRPVDVDPKNGDTRQLSFALGPLDIAMH